jgi:hypothetical protein
VTGPVRPRNLQFERDVTEQAARGYVDPRSLICHAETRARSLCGEYVTNPMLVLQGRDRILDVREELVDARNHIVWWLEDNLDDPTAAQKLHALQLICIAYAALAAA